MLRRANSCPRQHLQHASQHLLAQQSSIYPRSHRLFRGGCSAALQSSVSRASEAANIHLKETPYVPPLRPTPTNPKNRHLQKSIKQTPLCANVGGYPSPGRPADEQTAPPARPKRHPIQRTMEQLLANPRTKREHILTQIKRNSSLVDALSDREGVVALAESMALSPTPMNSLRALNLAHALGTPLKANAFEAVAHALAKSGQWELISAVVHGCRHIAKRLTTRLINWQTRALVEKQNYAALDDVLPTLEQNGLSPTRRTFHLLISGYIRNHDLPKAKQTIVGMEKAGFPVDASTNAIISSIHRVMGPDEQVQVDALKSLEGASVAQTVVTLNVLLQNHLSTNDIQGALKILSHFNQTKLDPCIYQCTSSPSEAAVGTDSPLPISDINPDATTFNLLIQYMAKRQDLASTQRMVERMVAAGVQPDSKTMISLIRAFFRAGDEASALELAIKACASQGVSRQRWGCLRPRKRHPLPSFASFDLTPTVVMFNALCKGVLFTQGMVGLFPLLEVMRLVKVEPDANTVQLVLNHLERDRRARPLTLLRVLRRLTRGTVRPTIRHLHVVLQSVIRREKFLTSRNGWRSCQRKHYPLRESISLDHLTSTLERFDPSAGIQVPKRTRYRRLFRGAFQSLAARNARSDGALVSLRIRRDAVNKGDLMQAQEVFRTMLERGIHPEPYHYAALLEGYARNGDMNAAEDVLEHAVSAGIKLNVVMFTVMIVGYAQNKKPRMAVKTFQRMLSMNIKPDIPSIDALCCAFFAVGSFVMAKELLISLWPYIAPLPAGAHTMSLQELAMRFRALRDTGEKASRALDKGERMKLYLNIHGMMKNWRRLHERDLALQAGPPKRR